MLFLPYCSLEDEMFGFPRYFSILGLITVVIVTTLLAVFYGWTPLNDLTQGSLVVGITLILASLFVLLFFVKRDANRIHQHIEGKGGEEALKAVHDRLQYLLASSPAIIYTNQASGRLSCTFVSENFQAITGYRVDEARNDPRFWVSHLDPYDAPRVLSKVYRVIARGGGAVEYRFRHRDGRYRWIHDTLKVITDEAGRPVEIVGSWTDITERKQAEEELRQSERQVRRVLEEREQLCRDLHDGILQSLYAVGLGLETCKQLVEEDPKEALEDLDRAIVRVNTVMREVRNFIAGKESNLLDEEDFEAALTSIVHAMNGARYTRFQVRLDSAAAGKLTKEQAIPVLKVSREAMSNIIRHAKAQHGVVSVQMKGNRIRLEVSDDGVGFDVLRRPRQGHGLTNMEARAVQLGGRLRILSQPGCGTRIVLDIPQERAHVESFDKADQAVVGR
ncbi:MAG: PAS domain-containing protein [Nitrospiraceae bacterium]